MRQRLLNTWLNSQFIISEWSAATSRFLAPSGVPAAPAQLLQLETRLLLSATPAVDPAQLDTMPAATDDSAAQQDIASSLVGAPHNDAETTVALPGSLSPLAANEFSSHTAQLELVVVDPDVADYGQLLEQLRSASSADRQFLTLVLDGSRDGVEQITEALQDLPTGQVAAVHLVSHGTAGQFKLGNTWIHRDNLAGYAGDLASWQTSLTAEADLLIYGCNLAANSAGEELMAALGALTGADVAASTDATGHVSWGADWTLEATQGAIQAPIVFTAQTQAAWNHVLATSSFQQGAAGFTGATDTYVDTSAANTNQSTTVSIRVDASPTSQGLLRFDNIFGTGASQIPWGSTITSATLTVNVLTPLATANTISLHQVLVPWTGTLTWNGWNGGVNLDGTEAQITADATLINTTGTGAQSFTDLSSRLQAWSNGQANYGWVISSAANQPWVMSSSEDATSAQRPQLSVTYTPPKLTATNDMQVNTHSANGQTTTGQSRGSQHAVAMAANGNYVVVWSSQNQLASGWEVYGQRYQANGTALGSEFLVNTHTTDEQQYASVAADRAGNFVVTWTSNNQDGPGVSVYAQRFAADGTRLGTEFKVNTANDGDQTDPTIDMNVDTGEFIIVWEGKGSTDDDGIYFRRFQANGTPLDASDRRANATNAGEERDATVAYTAGGNFVIAWEVNNKLYFQQFNSSGSTVNGVAQIDNFLADSTGVTVAAAANGDFTVAYREQTLIPGIWIRGYNADGTEKYTYSYAASGDASSPSLNMLADGSLLLTYQRTSDGSSEGIFLRRYAADGSSLGSAFSINQYTTNEQRSPSVAALDLNNYVVVWSGKGASESDGVFARQFTAPNQPPTASSDTYSVLEDGTLVVPAAGVLANDTDVDGDAMTASLVTGPSSGTLSLAADGSFTYTPQPNFSGTDSFVYRAQDATGFSANQTVSLTVVAQNDPPVANNDSYSAMADNSLTINAAGVLQNDTDIDGDALTAVLVAGPSHGTVVLNPNGSFTYTPTTGFVGSDSFTYQAHDNTISSNTAAVSITVSSTSESLVNAPSANNQQTLSQSRGSHRAVDYAADGSFVVVWSAQNQDGSGWGVFARRYQSSGAPLGNEFQVNTFTTGNQYQASVAVAPDGRFVIVWASENQDGTASSVYYSVYAADGSQLLVATRANTTATGSQASPTVSIDGSANFVIAWEGNGPGDTDGVFMRRFQANGTALDATDIRVNTTTSSNQGDPAVSLNTAGQFIVTWDDVNGVHVQRYNANGTTLGGRITVETDNTAGDGSVLFRDDGSFVVTWRQTNSGARDVFARVYNSSGSATTSAFIVNPTRSNDQTNPSISGDAQGKFIITWEGQGTGDSSGIFARKYSATGTALTGEFIINQTTAGTQSMSSLSMLTINDYVVVWSGAGTGDSNGVFLRKFTNFTPVSNNDAYTVAEDTLLTVSVPTVLANDTDLNNDTLTAVLVTGPSHGTLTLNTNGTFTYLAQTNYFGTDSFTYQASDGLTTSTAATVTLTITPVNDAPTAVADSFTINEDTTLTVPVAGILANDTDVEGQTLTANLVSGPSHGTLSLNSNGSFTYTPTLNYFGADSFTYRASDGARNSATTTVSLTIQAVNDNPIANSTTVSVNQNSSIVRSVAGLASDIENQALQFFVVDGVSHGTLTFNTNGGYVYAPNTNYVGADSFRYAAQDTLGGTSMGIVTINVLAVNQPPSITSPSSFTVNENNRTVTTLTATDIDSPPSSFTWSIIGGDDSSRFSVVSSSGELTFRVAPNYEVPRDANRDNNYDVIVRVSDGQATSSRRLNVIVTDVNEAPTGQADQFSTFQQDGPTTISDNVLSNDSDPDSYPLQAVLISQPQHGTLELRADGTFVYVAAAGYVGADSFTYLPLDGQLGGSPTQVTLNVEPLVAPTPQAVTGSSVERVVTTQTTTTTTSTTTTTTAAAVDPIPLPPPPTVIQEVESSDDEQLAPPPTGSAGQAGHSPVNAPVDGGNNDSFNDSSLLSRRGNYSARLLSNNSTSFADTRPTFVNIPDLVVLSEPGEFWRELDQLEKSTQEHFVLDDLFVGSVGSFASSLTVGYVVWMLRGGVLLSSLVAQMPAWKFIDPIVILPNQDLDANDREDDSLESIVDRGVTSSEGGSGHTTDLDGDSPSYLSDSLDSSPIHAGRSEGSAHV